jgi:hypothetical protein
MWTLTNAHGKNNVYLAICFGSDSSVDYQDGVLTDSYMICRGDGDTPPAGL